MEIEPTHKECSKCHQNKPIEEFRHRIGRSGKRRAACGDCHNAYLRFREAHPEILEEGRERRQESKKLKQEGCKRCSKCHQVKLFSQFNARPHDKSKPYASRCKICLNADRREERKRKPEIFKAQAKRRDEKRKKDPERFALYNEKRKEHSKKYKKKPQASQKRQIRKAQSPRVYYSSTDGRHSVTRDEYNAFLESQNGVCAICQQPETVKTKYGKIRTLGIDHDHATKKARGLLCMKCNMDLGKIEKRAFLEASQAYLERHQKLD